MTTTLAQRNAKFAYEERRREAGYVRIGVILAPADLQQLGRLMSDWGVSREEAVRRAIRIAAKAAPQPLNHEE